MADIITIELPKTVSENEIATLQADLKAIESVENARPTKRRGVDPQAAMMWVQFATGALSAVTTGLPILQKVSEAVRGKGIKGAKIALADGTTISLDRVSADDLERLIKASK